MISSLHRGCLVLTLSCGAVVTGGVENLSCTSGNRERDRDKEGLFVVLSGSFFLDCHLVVCFFCFFICDTVTQRSLERNTLSLIKGVILAVAL